MTQYAGIDVETTGLDEQLHEIVQITIMVFDKEYKIGKTFCSLMKPFRENTIDAKAMEINQLSIEKLRTAPNPMTVKEEVIDWIQNEVGDMIIPVGFNYKGFDKNFITNWLGKKNYKDLFFYKPIEVDSIIIADCMGTDIFPELEDEYENFMRTGKGFSLAKICEILNLIHKAHDSTSDTWCTIKLLELRNRRIMSK